MAEELINYGLKIWYHEFSLRYGDSLSASQDISGNGEGCLGAE